MPIMPGGTSCSLTGRISYDGWYGWGGKIDSADFIFWIARNDWRMYWCFRSLYIVAILWNMIQASLGSLCVARFFLNMDTFTNPKWEFLFGSHNCPPFYSRAWLLYGNTWQMIFIGCCNRHTSPWLPWLCSATDVQHRVSPRAGHGKPQYQLMQLPMNPHLRPGKLVNLLS